MDLISTASAHCRRPQGGRGSAAVVRNRPRTSSSFAFAAALACTTCSFVPSPPVVEPVGGIPSEFAATSGLPGRFGPAADSARPASRWWAAFEDPVLNAVVDSVLASNFDLAEAVARVRQARAHARIAKAPLLPAVGLSAAATDQDTPANAGLGAQFRALGLGGDSTAPALDRLAFTTWSASLDFSYELDFWGRGRNDARAAASDYLASESDFQAARIAVVAETITTYFEIVDLRRRTALAREVADMSSERATLAEIRYGRGLIPSFQLYQLRQDLQEARAALPGLETALAGAEGRLAVLLGGFVRDLDMVLPDSLAPVLATASPHVGVPADLLLQRPDVRAAGQRMEAARYRVGARRADLLPALSLSGSVGLQSADAAGLFDADQWFRNLVANLAAPLFQGGRLRGAVGVAEAQFDQAAAAFGRSVVTAAHEVEAALTRFRNDERRHAFLQSERSEARASAELQARRYAGGVGGYADYLDAQRNLLNVESALAAAQRDVALARLAVHRAVGGAWVAPEESGLREVEDAGAADLPQGRPR